MALEQLMDAAVAEADASSTNAPAPTASERDSGETSESSPRGKPGNNSNSGSSSGGGYDAGGSNGRSSGQSNGSQSSGSMSRGSEPGGRGVRDHQRESHRSSSVTGDGGGIAMHRPGGNVAGGSGGDATDTAGVGGRRLRSNSQNGNGNNNGGGGGNNSSSSNNTNSGVMGIVGLGGLGLSGLGLGEKSHSQNHGHGHGQHHQHHHHHHHHHHVSPMSPPSEAGFPGPAPSNTGAQTVGFPSMTSSVDSRASGHLSSHSHSHSQSQTSASVSASASGSNGGGGGGGGRVRSNSGDDEDSVLGSAFGVDREDAARIVRASELAAARRAAELEMDLGLDDSSSGGKTSQAPPWRQPGREHAPSREEKAARRRALNRINAKRSRVRKKLFIESLVSRISELEKERDHHSQSASSLPNPSSSSSSHSHSHSSSSSSSPLHLQQPAVAVVHGPAPGSPVVSLTPELEVLTGLRREWLLGRSLRALFGPGTDPTAAAHIVRAIETSTPLQGTVILYTASGHPFWASITLTPLFAPSGPAPMLVATIARTTRVVGALPPPVDPAALAHAREMAAPQFGARLSTQASSNLATQISAQFSPSLSAHLTTTTPSSAAFGTKPSSSSSSSASHSKISFGAAASSSSSSSAITLPTSASLSSGYNTPHNHNMSVASTSSPKTLLPLTGFPLSIPLFTQAPAAPDMAHPATLPAAGDKRPAASQPTTQPEAKRPQHG